MAPLHLAVDARVAVEDTRGIGRYARAVLRRLIADDGVEVTCLVADAFPRRRRAAYERALGSDRFRFARRAGKQHDCLWHPANGTFFSGSVPSVATIHDAIPFRYPNPDPKRRRHAQEPFLRSARTAARVITVSRFARSELHELFDLPTRRIAVIPHGVEPSFAPGVARTIPTGLQGRDFFLFVGDPIREPRKNFEMLYEAYRQAWPHGDGPLLAVAGPRAPERPGVVALGDFNDDLVSGTPERLRDCYRAAVALTIPSYHETFGMPLLEAMACGTPAIAAAAGSLPEVGDTAPLYAPPDSVNGWADALRRVSNNAALRERLRAAGLRQARRFSWDQSA
ncbi:MAG: glycosyltransferase family 4 protein, partial [Candidatus Eremiobacteraeota bacterium]|nr:glycosyltransferase family 4 protein [Candidatus Eremiobacteraeota bacterium]